MTSTSRLVTALIVALSLLLFTASARAQQNLPVQSAYPGPNGTVIVPPVSVGAGPVYGFPYGPTDVPVNDGVARGLFQPKNPNVTSLVLHGTAPGTVVTGGGQMSGAAFIGTRPDLRATGTFRSGGTGFAPVFTPACNSGCPGPNGSSIQQMAAGLGRPVIGPLGYGGVSASGRIDSSPDCFGKGKPVFDGAKDGKYGIAFPDGRTSELPRDKVQRIFADPNGPARQSNPFQAFANPNGPKPAAPPTINVGEVTGAYTRVVGGAAAVAGTNAAGQVAVVLGSYLKDYNRILIDWMNALVGEDRFEFRENGPINQHIWDKKLGKPHCAQHAIAQARDADPRWEAENLLRRCGIATVARITSIVDGAVDQDTMVLRQYCPKAVQLALQFPSPKLDCSGKSLTFELRPFFNMKFRPRDSRGACHLPGEVVPYEFAVKDCNGDNVVLTPDQVLVVFKKGTDPNWGPDEQPDTEPQVVSIEPTTYLDGSPTGTMLIKVKTPPQWNYIGQMFVGITRAAAGKEPLSKYVVPRVVPGVIIRVCEEAVYPDAPECAKPTIEVGRNCQYGQVCGNYPEPIKVRALCDGVPVKQSPVVVTMPMAQGKVDTITVGRTDANGELTFVLPVGCSKSACGLNTYSIQVVNLITKMRGRLIGVGTGEDYCGQPTSNECGEAVSISIGIGSDPEPEGGPANDGAASDGANDGAASDGAADDGAADAGTDGGTDGGAADAGADASQGSDGGPGTDSGKDSGASDGSGADAGNGQPPNSIDAYIPEPSTTLCQAKGGVVVGDGRCYCPPPAAWQSDGMGSALCGPCGNVPNATLSNGICVCAYGPPFNGFCPPPDGGTSEGGTSGDGGGSDGGTGDDGSTLDGGTGVDGGASDAALEGAVDDASGGLDGDISNATGTGVLHTRSSANVAMVCGDFVCDEGEHCVVDCDVADPRAPAQPTPEGGCTAARVGVRPHNGAAALLVLGVVLLGIRRTRTPHRRAPSRASAARGRSVAKA